MRRLLPVLAATSAALAAFSFVPRSGAASEETSPASVDGAGWREGVQCGPNGLYLFLKLCGWKGTLSDVRSVVNVTDERGCSLATLYHASKRLGVPVKLIKTDLQGLQKRRLPAIVHLDNPEFMQAGHFVLVLGVGTSRLTEQKVVHVIDPILARRQERTAAQFERQWTSYALVRSDPWSPEWAMPALWILLGCNSVVGSVFAFRKLPSSRNLKHQTA